MCMGWATVSNDLQQIGQAQRLLQTLQVSQLRLIHPHPLQLLIALLALPLLHLTHQQQQTEQQAFMLR